MADSKSQEGFLGYKMTEGAPDHSSLSRIRHRLSLEAHKQVFAKVLEILKKEGLLKGKKIGLDASNIEANAAMRSIRRKIDGKRYLIHACAFNLSLVMRQLYRAGTPRGPEALIRLLLRHLFGLLCSVRPRLPFSAPKSALSARNGLNLQFVH